MKSIETILKFNMLSKYLCMMMHNTYDDNIYDDICDDIYNYDIYDDGIYDDE